MGARLFKLGKYKFLKVNLRPQLIKLNIFEKKLFVSLINHFIHLF